MNHTMGFGMGWVMWLVFIIFPLLLIGGAFAVFSHGRKPDNDALTILKRRYANGEISQEEFEQKKKALERD